MPVSYRSFRAAMSAGMRPLVGAHRGASTRFPENTLAAFNAAIIQGADFLELDVRLSRDEIPVVIHDPTIERTTAGHGQVSHLTAAELSSFGVPLLDSVLELGKQQLFFNIELKQVDDPAALIRAVLSAVRLRQLEYTVLISSFDHQLLPIIKRENPSILTGVLYEYPLIDPVGYAMSLQADALHPYYRLLNHNLVHDAHNHGLFVIPWTVDRPSYLRYCRKIGVDGIITNTPDIAISLLNTG